MHDTAANTHCQMLVSTSHHCRRRRRIDVDIHGKMGIDLVVIDIEVDVTDVDVNVDIEVVDVGIVIDVGIDDNVLFLF